MPSSKLSASSKLSQPKQPVGGAYGVFITKHRARFTKACQGLRSSFISKLAGEEWAKLTKSQRQPYEKEYQSKKAKFDKEMKAYLESGGVKQPGRYALKAAAKRQQMLDLEAREAKIEKKLRQVEKAKVKRERTSKTFGGKLSSSGGRSWRARCQERARQVKVEADIADEEDAAEAAAQAIAKAKIASRERMEAEDRARKRKLREKDPDRPKKPTGGGFGVFLNKHRKGFQAECAGQSVAAVSKLASSRWKALSEKEKKPYMEQFQKLTLAYHAALRKFNPPEKIAKIRQEIEARRRQARGLIEESDEEEEEEEAEASEEEEVEETEDEEEEEELE